VAGEKKNTPFNQAHVTGVQDCSFSKSFLKSMRSSFLKIRIPALSIRERELTLSPTFNWLSRQLLHAHKEGGDDLYFQSYAYSEKPDLFTHPYHKSQIPNQIRLLPNGKMRMTFEIGGEKNNVELTRE